MKQGLINHIAFDIDASGSMAHLTRDVIKVADAQIKYLAQRSQELDQETRVTVYLFNHAVQCVIFDKDVLRLPSIAEFYKASGQTALIDATLLSQDDLAKTAQMYGDHAFLTFVLTDGAENASRNYHGTLSDRLNSLPENWTVAVLVPDQTAKFEAKKFGFPVDNIAIWDATSVKGFEEAGRRIREATDAYMTSRASGVRGTRSLFSTGADAVNKTTIRDDTLRFIHKSKYEVFDITKDASIRDFVENKGYDYAAGCAFYQLMKRETIQAQKLIVIRNKKTGTVYTGDNARTLLGLRDTEERVSPDHNPEFDVFVQSTSHNRKLIAGTKLIVMVA